jgi:hypothetical protein
VSTSPGWTDEHVNYSSGKDNLLDRKLLVDAQLVSRPGRSLSAAIAATTSSTLGPVICLAASIKRVSASRIAVVVYTTWVLGRRREEPSARRKRSGTWHSSGGVSRSDLATASSVTRSATATQSSGEAKRTPCKTRCASARRLCRP